MKVREIMNIIVVRCTWLHIGYRVDKVVKTQLRGVRIEGDTPLKASPGQPQICLDFLLGLKQRANWSHINSLGSETLL